MALSTSQRPLDRTPAERSSTEDGAAGVYLYRGLNQAGKRVKGTLNARSERDARAIAQERALYLTDLRLQHRGSWNVSWFRPSGGPQKLSAAQLSAFTRQMATLIRAAIPYDRALSMIQQENADSATRATLAAVQGRVEEGAYLADALSFAATNQKQSFPPLVVSMVRAGEAGGTLAPVMERLADHYGRIQRLQSRVTSALMYPAFMMLFSTAVVFFMITYVIPKISRLFDQFGNTLPLPTRILISISGLLTGFWWILLPMGISFVYAGVRIFNLPRVRAQWHRLELVLPLWSSLRRRTILHRFTETLATLLHSGVDLGPALEVAGGVMDNGEYRRTLKDAMLNVQNRGFPLAQALSQSTLFPGHLCQMVSIGEETGALAEMLENVSMRYAQEVETTLDGLTSLLEPLMILVMGIVVGFIVMSVLLPMLQLNQLAG